MDLETIFGIKLATSVKLGRLFVPVNSLASYLHRYIDPALFLTGMDPPYEFTKSGSLTRVLFENRFYVIICAHQLRKQKYEYDQLAIKSRTSNVFFTSNSAHFPTGYDSVEEDVDLIIFDFTDAVIKGNFLKHDWYSLDQDSDLETRPMPFRLTAIGYPSDLNNINYDDSSYQAVAVSVWGKPDKSSLSKRLRFTPDGQVLHPPFGMSGGGVFGLYLDGFTARVYLAGILTEATQSAFNFFSITRIEKILKSINIKEKQL